jgi:hypothetical protein
LSTKLRERRNRIKLELFGNSLITTVFLNFRSPVVSSHDIQLSTATIQFLSISVLRFTNRNSIDQTGTIWRNCHQLISSLISRNPSHSRFTRQEHYIKQNFYHCSRSVLNFLKGRHVIDFCPEVLDDSHPWYSGQKEMSNNKKNHAWIILILLAIIYLE